MIWYFIAGFVSGVVGTLMLGKWAGKILEKIDDDERSE